MTTLPKDWRIFKWAQARHTLIIKIVMGLELAEKLYPHFHVLLLGLAILFGFTLCLGVFIVMRRYNKFKNIHQADPSIRAAKAREIHKEIKYLVEIRDELDPTLAKAENGRIEKAIEQAEANAVKQQTSATQPAQQVQEMKESISQKELKEKQDELAHVKSEIESLMLNVKNLEQQNKDYESVVKEGRKRIEKLESNLETKLQEIVVLNKRLKEYKRIEAEVSMSEEEKAQREFTAVKKPQVQIEDYSQEDNQGGEQEDPLLEEFKKVLKSSNE